MGERKNEAANYNANLAIRQDSRDAMLLQQRSGMTPLRVSWIIAT
jgi:hypothetical protein